MLGLPFKTLPSDQNILTAAYKTYVRPILEYATPVWSPYLTKDIILLENVQRYFTRRVLGYPNLSYPERLIVLGLDFLEMRRLHHDLTSCYKILSCNAHVNSDNFFVLASNTNLRFSNRSANSKKLILPCSRVNVRKYFFSSRIVSMWNSLSDEVVNSNSVQVFRARLHNTDLSNFLSGVRLSD